MITRTCMQATATTMANGYNTAMIFHDVSKIGKRTLATVHFKNSFSVVSRGGNMELSQLTNGREHSCRKTVY